MKILLHNIGYALGHSGSIFDYVFKSLRFLTRPEKVISENIHKINEKRLEFDSDLAFYMEVDKKYQEQLLDGSRGEVVNKYINKKKESFGNALVTDLDYHIHYAPFGKKALFFEVVLSDDIHLIGFHFSLVGKTRKKQFEFFKKYMESQGKKYILCGDFNIFGGVQELDCLDMQVVSSEPTFPAHKPKHALDLFLLSPGISVTSHTIYNDTISDHLCVSLEVEI